MSALEEGILISAHRDGSAGATALASAIARSEDFADVMDQVPGLAMELTSTFHGTIDCRTEVGVGTTFVVTIPLAGAS